MTFEDVVIFIPGEVLQYVPMTEVVPEAKLKYVLKVVD